MGTVLVGEVKMIKAFIMLKNHHMSFNQCINKCHVSSFNISLIPLLIMLYL